MECQIIVIGKRRNGKPKYWCMTHGSYAWDEKGELLAQCPKAGQDDKEKLMLQLDVRDYPGGVGIWGALSPVYDTTQLPKSKRVLGVHVHARKEPCKAKELDDTFDIVYLKIDDASEPIEINGVDASALSLSIVGGYEVSVVKCSHCGALHSDLGYLAIWPHRKHVCNRCGRDFFVKEANIGNPLALIEQQLKQYFGDRPTVEVDRKLVIEQTDFPGGVRIWASNPAILWTADRPEEKGIHVHCYDQDNNKVIDDTFGYVEIDGIVLNDEHVRKYMVQVNVDVLKERTVSLQCPYCDTPHFDSGKRAWQMHVKHTCHSCGKTFEATTRYKKVVSNPLVNQIGMLISKLSGAR